MPALRIVPPFTPYEAALLLRINRTTLHRWAVSGDLPSFRTPGGHRRYPAVPLLRRVRARAQARHLRDCGGHVRVGL